jgi:hypothetical protein
MHEVMTVVDECGLPLVQYHEDDYFDRSSGLNMGALISTFSRYLYAMNRNEKKYSDVYQHRNVNHC